MFQQVAAQQVEAWAEKYASAAAQLAEFAVVFLAIYLVGRFVLAPIVDRLFGGVDLDPTLRRPLNRVVRFAVAVVAFSTAFTAAGFGDALSVTGPIIAALTLALGFASRDIASNLVSGVFIVTDPKFRIGDWIEWNGREGVIEDITFRVTRVRTFDNELVTVPNSELATNAVTNAVEQKKLRIAHVFYVGYDDDLDMATAILLEEAERHPDILFDPEPTVRIAEVNDARVGIQSRVWIDIRGRAEYVRIRSEYFRRVTDRFRAAGIELPPSW